MASRRRSSSPFRADMRTSLEIELADAVGEDVSLATLPSAGSSSTSPTEAPTAHKKVGNTSHIVHKHNMPSSSIPRPKVLSNGRRGSTPSFSTHSQHGIDVNVEAQPASRPETSLSAPDPWLQEAEALSSPNLVTRKSSRRSLNPFASFSELSIIPFLPSKPQDTDNNSIKSSKSTGGRFLKAMDMLSEHKQGFLSFSSPTPRASKNYVAHWTERRGRLRLPEIYVLPDEELSDPRDLSRSSSPVGSHVQDFEDQVDTSSSVLESDVAEEDSDEPTRAVSGAVYYSDGSEGDWEDVGSRAHIEPVSAEDLRANGAPDTTDEAVSEIEIIENYQDHTQTLPRTPLHNSTPTLGLNLAVSVASSEHASISPPRTLSLSSSSNEADESFSPVRNSTIESLSPYVAGGKYAFSPRQDGQTAPQGGKTDLRPEVKDKSTIMLPQEVYSQEPTQIQIDTTTLSPTPTQETFMEDIVAIFRPGIEFSVTGLQEDFSPVPTLRRISTLPGSPLQRPREGYTLAGELNIVMSYIIYHFLMLHMETAGYVNDRDILNSFGQGIVLGIGVCGVLRWLVRSNLFRVEQ